MYKTPAYTKFSKNEVLPFSHLCNMLIALGDVDSSCRAWNSLDHHVPRRGRLIYRLMECFNETKNWGWELFTCIPTVHGALCPEHAKLKSVIRNETPLMLLNCMECNGSSAQDFTCRWHGLLHPGALLQGLQPNKPQASKALPFYPISDRSSQGWKEGVLLTERTPGWGFEDEMGALANEGEDQK